MRARLRDGWSVRRCRRPESHAGRRRNGWGLCGQSPSDTFIRRGSPVRAADWAYNRCRHAAVDRFHIKSITLPTAALNFDRNHGWNFYSSFPDSESSFSCQASHRFSLATLRGNGVRRKRVPAIYEQGRRKKMFWRIPIANLLKNPIDQNTTVENTTINWRTTQENASYRILARKIF